MATLRTGGGAGHSIQLPQIIANNSLMALMDSLVFPRITSRDYQHYFANRIGNEFSVKKAFQVIATDGRTLAKQPMIDETVTIKVNIVAHTAIGYDIDAMTLDINNFRERYLDPCGIELAYKYDEAGGKEFHVGAYYMSGTAGSSMSISNIHTLAAYWTKLSMPQGGRRCAVMDPLDLASIAVEIKDLDNPHLVGQTIRGLYKGEYAGFSLYSTNHLPPFQVADYGTSTPLVNSSTAYQGSTLPTDGWANSTAILNKGQLITIAGVNEVQPRGDRHDIGRLKTFLVTEDVTSNNSGQASIKIEPELNAGTLNTTDSDGNNVSKRGYKNCTAVAANNAVIKVVGAGSDGAGKGKSFRQGMFFDPSAMQYSNIQLIPLQGFGFSSLGVDSQTGLSILLTGDGDITNMKETQRLDILGAVKVTRPEVLMRFISQEI